MGVFPSKSWEGVAQYMHFITKTHCPLVVDVHEWAPCKQPHTGRLAKAPMTVGAWHRAHDHGRFARRPQVGAVRGAGTRRQSPPTGAPRARATADSNPRQ